jgi:hypothetical protein
MAHRLEIEVNPSHYLKAPAEFPAVLPTNEAASVINRQPQTLRKWACLETGPIRPLRINGRLAWRVSDLQALLNEGGANHGGRY